MGDRCEDGTYTEGTTKFGTFAEVNGAGQVKKWIAKGLGMGQSTAR